MTTFKKIVAVLTLVVGIVLATKHTEFDFGIGLVLIAIGLLSL